MNTSTQPAEARNKQRYRYIRYLAELQGVRIYDLYRKFIASSRRPCHYSVFYRVCQGRTVSRRIQRFVAGQLKINWKELWS